MKPSEHSCSLGVGQQQQEHQLTWNGSVVVGVWAKVHLPFFNDP